MADPITDPQAVAFANEHVRPLADRLAGTVRELKVYQAWRQAKGTDALFPADGGAVADGSPGDGRTPITGGDVATFNAVVDSLVASIDAGGAGVQNAVLKVAVNPR